MRRKAHRKILRESSPYHLIYEEGVAGSTGEGEKKENGKVEDREHA